MKGVQVDWRDAMEGRLLSGGYRLVVSRLPFRRDQDVALIQDFGPGGPVVGLVDGWNHPEAIASDQPGRDAAAFVARSYPEAFLALEARSLADAAQEAALRVDRALLALHPAHVASVGVFAFCSPRQIRVVSVGTIGLWSWNGTRWLKPRGIGDWFLPQPPHASGSRTFWGRGELKGDPFYALCAETATLSADKPLLMATDGIDDVLTLAEINRVQAERGQDPEAFFSALTQRAQCSPQQRDDITLLMLWKG